MHLKTQRLHTYHWCSVKNIRLRILGPFGWPKYENGLTALADIPGVYLMTVKHQDGFLPYGVGVTRRHVKKRFLEHTRSFEKGEYNILDMGVAQQGIRRVVWKGWGWTPEKRADYETRQDEIIAVARRQMLATCIFIVETGVAPRLLERIEASIANHFYGQGEILFDRGMLCMPRWKSEERLVAIFQCESKLYGLPSEIEI